MSRFVLTVLRFEVSNNIKSNCQEKGMPGRSKTITNEAQKKKESVLNRTIPESNPDHRPIRLAIQRDAAALDPVYADLATRSP